MNSLLVSACVDRFVTWTAANRRPATVEHYRYQLGRFVELHGRRRLDRVTPALLTTWSQSSHALQSVLRLCSWCHRFERSLKVNPLAGMPKPRMGQRRRVLERGEMIRLLRAADATFRRFLILCRESMCRPQEARAITWGDVVESAAERYSAPGKGRRRTHFALPTGKHFEFRRQVADERTIPISPRLARLLGRMARRPVTLTDRILRDSKGRAWTANAVRCRMRRLRIRANVVADRRGERVVVYSFRHTGATAAAAAGIGEYVLAGVLGHASPRTTERYVHLRPADLVEAMKRVYEAKTADRPKNDRVGLRRTNADDQR